MDSWSEMLERKSDINSGCKICLGCHSETCNKCITHISNCEFMVNFSYLSVTHKVYVFVTHLWWRTFAPRQIPPPELSFLFHSKFHYKNPLQESTP